LQASYFDPITERESKPLSRQYIRIDAMTTTPAAAVVACHQGEGRGHIDSAAGHTASSVPPEVDVATIGRQDSHRRQNSRRATKGQGGGSSSGGAGSCVVPTAAPAA
jgi:hypothetical protein